MLRAFETKILFAFACCLRGRSQNLCSDFLAPTTVIQHFRDLVTRHRAAAAVGDGGDTLDGGGGGVNSTATVHVPARSAGPPPSRSGRRSAASPAPSGSGGPAPPVRVAVARNDDDAMRQTIVMRPRR